MHAFMMLIHSSTIIGQNRKSVYKLNISKNVQKVNLNMKKKTFVHNYKLPSIQLRLKTFTEKLID